MAERFPEKVRCPKPCQGIGAFKKGNQSLDELISEYHEKATAAIQGPGPGVTQGDRHIVAQDVDEPVISASAKEEFNYLEPLRPGKDGKVDWTPLSDLTGTRPRVSKYSVTRYSIPEWTKHNEEVLSTKTLNKANIIDYDTKTAMMAAFGNVDKQQIDNNYRLKQRAKEMFRWKMEMERACKAMAEEVELLEVERQRLKGASRTLMLPEAISKECLDLRSNRAVPDLVVDVAEQELIKEMNMVSVIRTTLRQTLMKIEEQQTKNKAVKHKAEYDWCDKTLAYQVDCLNMSLNPKSSTLLFRPGSVKFPEYSAPMEFWEYYCRESINECEAARQQSAELRGSFHSILVNGGQKLRMQADKTDAAIAETVAKQTELCTKLENNLHQTLTKIADMERLIEELRQAIRKMDNAMKLAQTRLENRTIKRGRGESVQDKPHIGLLGEVKVIHETVTALRAQMHKAEAVRNELLSKRIDLEKDIAAKLKTLNIDRNRCGIIRSHYPSALELAGY